MSEIKNAQIEVLWIAEDKPDLFSALIMWFLDRPYSHNAILYKGKMWHATTGTGVTEADPKKEMHGCHVAARVNLTLNCTEDHFDGFLLGEKGKGYDVKANIGLLFPRARRILANIPIVRMCISDPDKSRNCSEFVGNIVNLFYLKLPGEKQTWTPAFTEKVLQPKRLV